jgi:putative OPT family oligopeptide transporter
MNSKDPLPHHEPFVPAHTKIAELTPIPIVMGVLLGIVFGASSLYLALKVGMTVSASIPIAVMSITIFKVFSNVLGVRKTTILENNIVQTTGSAGESIACGIAITMPALLIMGYDMELTQVMLVAVLGGLIGVLMMIPLRWALIVKEHGKLSYPEGTACAEVLIVGEKGGTNAKTVFMGFGIGFVYKLLNVGMRLWKDVPEKAITWYKGATWSTEVSPELLGVGYIIGPRIASRIFAGGILATFVLTPAIFLFGGGLLQPLFPATKLISEMSTREIWKNYVLYIGAGAVAAGGIISVIQGLPTIFKSMVLGFSALKNSRTAKTQVSRTEQDLPIPFVIAGIILIILAIWIIPTLQMNLMGAILIVAFGFVFVTVSSRLVGTIGSSSNPISGMTIATLLLTCLIFVILGWVGPEYRITALCIGSIVCVAVANGGTTSQDLKTGFLIGATPKNQQIGLIIGSIISALVVGYTMLILNDASTIYHKVDHPDVAIEATKLTKRAKVHGPEAAHDPKEYGVLHLNSPLGSAPIGKYLVDDYGKLAYLVDPGINGTLKTRDDGTPVQKYDAPKARLMSLIIDGILTQKLPWGLVFLGVFIAIVLELCGITSLPFAIGIYLPIATTAPIFMGGLIRRLTEYASKKKEEEAENSPGVLLSSGLIAGGAIAGIGLALFSVNERLLTSLDFGKHFPAFSGSDLVPYLFFGAMALYLFAVGRGWLLKDKKA